METREQRRQRRQRILTAVVVAACILAAVGLPAWLEVFI